MKYSEFMPYDILPSGAIISDHRGAITFVFELSLPIIYTMEDQDYSNLIENFRKFTELLGEEVLYHKQDIFHKEAYSYKTDNYDFVDNSYALHFNERPFLKMKSFLYITKVPPTDSTYLISKDFAKTFNDKDFLNQILNSADILKNQDFSLRPIGYEELISTESPITLYYNFSDTGQEEIKDVDFSNSTIHVGHEKVSVYTIENLGQFPAEDITVCKYENSMAVSNLFDFSYKLSVPHVLNTYLYVPSQKDIKLALDKKQNQLEGFDYKNSNKEAREEISLLEQKRSTLNVNYAYLHINIMCFGEETNIINKKINNAFASSGFKKKENTLSRKLIFQSGIPGNGLKLFEKEKNKTIMFSLLLDLEALCFFNWEQNYATNSTSTTGLKLADRLYGIPIDVDLYNEPKKKGWIKNQNMIVFAASGGGKSFLCNLINLNEYRQGAHIFIIDASFSYKLQTAMHKGVYLTYDDKSKISFNPFYIDWLDEKEAIKMFLESDSIKNVDDNDQDDNALLNKYSNLLEDKTVVLIGVLTAATKNEGEQLQRYEETIYRAIIFNYYKQRGLNNEKSKLSFDDFYSFTAGFLPVFLKEKNIENSFNYHEFLLMLDIFRTGNAMGYLLNSADEQIKNLDKERFVVVDVARIRQNKLLFSIVSILAMDLYNQKVAKLPIQTPKILVIDEAWQAISSPQMATFMKGQVKVIRKYGGRTMFISQELDDFLSSEIIKDSIINNSSIKIFADMGEFKSKFEPIKKALSLSDNNEKKILSLNTNNRPGEIYKECCILLESRGFVYSTIVPTELKAIFETDAEEVAKILPKLEQDGLELTATNYANRN
jgi:hypothetical protein